MASFRDDLTPTGLARWSVIQKQLPSSDRISEINVFDFDNTLFRTPMPNPQLWDGRSIGLLSSEDSFANGGWWHDPSLLSSLDGGVEVQEAKAWDGYWDEAVVEEVRLSMQSPTALTVLMTGRGQARFSELITRIVRSKQLDFDLIVLKPKIGPDGKNYHATFDFKMEFLRLSLLTYPQATEIAVFEDRPKHATAFEERLDQLSADWASAAAKGQPVRPPFATNVVVIEPKLTYFDADVELNAILRMMDASNLAVKMGRAKSNTRLWNMTKSRIYTGYLLQPQDTERLVSLIQGPDKSLPRDCRILADNIMISFRQPREDIIRRAGGWGAHRAWRVTGLGNFGNNIWAARLVPVDKSQSTYTESFTPLIVLAMKKSVKATEANRITNWVTIPENDERAIVFDTVVQNKVSVKLVEAPANGYHDGDGKTVLNGTKTDRNLPMHTRAATQQRQGQQNAADQSSADENGMDEQFPTLAKAAQQSQGQGRRRNDRRDRRGPQQYGQQGQMQRGGQQRDHHGGHQQSQGGRGRYGGGGGGGGGRAIGRRNRGAGGGQYRSLDDAGGGGNVGPSSAVGMQY